VCVSIAAGAGLPSHCLAMAAYSGFHPSCHNVLETFCFAIVQTNTFSILNHKSAAFVVRQANSLVTTFEDLQPSSHTIKRKQYMA
jgi:hypothetical protein